MFITAQTPLALTTEQWGLCRLSTNTEFSCYAYVLPYESTQMSNTRSLNCSTNV